MSTIPISMLKPGMILESAIFTPDNKVLLLQHNSKITVAAIEVLKNYNIRFVNISDPYSIYLNPTEALASFMEDFLDRKISKISPENQYANLTDVMPYVSARVRKIIKPMYADDEILKLCLEMKLVNDDKLFYPSLCTCAYSVLLAGVMELNDSDIYDVAVAALLHDIGICEMAYLIEAPHSYGPAESLWKEHPTYGHYIVKEHNISNSIATIIHYHHEQYNGSGYPHKMCQNAIPLTARIVNLCSDYCDLIYNQLAQPYQAIEYLYASYGILYDCDVLDAFTKNIPIYPLGSLVRLSTKEVGVVINVRKNMGPRPIIRVSYNNMNKPITYTKILDLAQEASVFIEEILL